MTAASTPVTSAFNASGFWCWNNEQINVKMFFLFFTIRLSHYFTDFFSGVAYLLAVCVSCKHTCVLFFLYKRKQLRFRYINNHIKLLLWSLISKRRTEVIHKHISRQVYKVHFSLYVLLQLHLLPVLKGVAQPGPKRMESGSTLFPFPEVLELKHCVVH